MKGVGGKDGRPLARARVLRETKDEGGCPRDRRNERNRGRREIAVHR